MIVQPSAGLRSKVRRCSTQGLNLFGKEEASLVVQYGEARTTPTSTGSKARDFSNLRGGNHRNGICHLQGCGVRSAERALERLHPALLEVSFVSSQREQEHVKHRRSDGASKR